MKKTLQKMITRLGIVGELIEFLWINKKWWLIPMAIILVLFGLLLAFATSTGLAPFIYTLF